MSTLDNGVFCFACENAAFKECNRLVAENAKLRDDLEDQEGYDQMLRDRLRQQTELCVKAKTENAKLHNENAKLRELVRELWEGYVDPPCEDCPFRDTPTCADCPICAREAAVIDRMRELGIEVPE